MYLTMLCLGELTVAMPVSGSFKSMQRSLLDRNGLYDWLVILAWLGSNSGSRINVNRFNDEKMVSKC